MQYALGGCKWENCTKVDLKEIGFEVTEVIKNRVQWQAVLNTVVNCHVL
jgi:hypothetical protein